MSKKTKQAARQRAQSRPTSGAGVSSASSSIPPKIAPAPTSSSKGLPSWIWLAAVIPLALIIVGIVVWQRNTPANTPASALAAAATPIATSAPTAVPATLGTADYCKKTPIFPQQMGFSLRAVLTTADKVIKGLVAYDLNEQGQPTRVFTHPTWSTAGYLGHITFDQGGNAYTFPSPRVSLIDNPPEQQNTLWRLDSTSAAFKPWLALTNTLPPSTENPFGLMGTTLDCDTGILYASTVAGSTRSNEAGQIVRINLSTKAILGEYKGVDAFGIGIFTTQKGKRLYYGLARQPQVYSIELNELGEFVSEPRLELTMPDTNFRPWRVQFDATGQMIVRGLIFNFNLAATSERRETRDVYAYDAASDSWKHMGN